MVATNQALEELLLTLGDIRDEGFPSFSCNIGDYEFLTLLKKVQWRYNHLEEVEEQNRQRALREIENDPDSAHREEDKALHLRFTNLIRALQGIDYSDTLKYQWEKVQSITASDWSGVPFRLADPHVHAYPPIVSVLDTSQEPVTILRLDAHTDCKENLEEKTTRANYISQLVFHPLSSRKITKIIQIGGGKIHTIVKSKVNGISYVRADPLRIPEIKGQVIVDIDLDGCENGGHQKEFNCCREGGHLYNNSTYYNQENISHHPRAMMRMIKAKISRPVVVLVALERGFRNRAFWYRVERDCLEELAA